MKLHGLNHVCIDRQRIFAGLFCLFIAIYIQGCFLPFIGGDGNKVETISIFDKKKFLEVQEFDFPEYKWNNNAKFAEEIYAKAMADYFFTDRYQNALEVLESARKVYPIDARIHVRIVECYARMGKLQEAINAISRGEEEIRGFSRQAGISGYLAELNKEIEMQKLAMDKPKRPLWKKILFAPAKLWPF